MTRLRRDGREQKPPRKEQEIHKKTGAKYVQNRKCPAGWTGTEEKRDAGGKRDSDRISLCRDFAPGNQINASRPKELYSSHRSFGGRDRLSAGLLLVSQFPEMHESTQSAALFLGRIRRIAWRLLFLVELAAFGMRTTDQLRQTGQARPFGGIRLTAAPVDSR